MLLTLWQRLRSIAHSDFSDIVVQTELLLSTAGRVRKLRIHLLDGSFVDVWLSEEGDYAFHWERRFVDGTIYRHDNAPHWRWKSVSTFPKHFHNGTEDHVTASQISDSPSEALEEFLSFVRTKL